MKHELEKMTGSMEAETKRVQQKAIKQYYASPEKLKRFKWSYPVVLVLFLCVLSIIFPLQKSEETASNVYIEPLNEQLFWIDVYTMQYNQKTFWTKADAIEHSFYITINRSALLTYAKQQNIVIDNEIIAEKVEQSIYHMENDTQAKFEIEKLLQTFNLTKDEYKEIIVHYATVNSVIDSIIKERGLKGPKGEIIGKIHNDALEFYELHAAEEIARFEALQRSKASSKPVLTKIQTPEEFGFANKLHPGLELGLNEQQQYEFINPDQTLYFIDQTYGALLYEAAPNKQYPFQFGPLYYMDYKRNIKQIAQQQSNMQDEAEQLLEILQIFERSYKEDYSFLQ